MPNEQETIDAVDRLEAHLNGKIERRKALAPAGTLWCAGVQRVGRARGLPCTMRASTMVDGTPFCTTHSRLKPVERRKAPAVGYKVGHKVAVNIGFTPESFETVRQMAADEGSSFGAMTRTLVDYALDEVGVVAGTNAPHSGQGSDNG